MQIGIDGRKIALAAELGAVGTLDHAKQIGMDGVFFRTVLDMTPTLDATVLRDVRSRADELGLYLQAGLGKVNPYANPETPEVREIGDGDTALGFRRMMEACAAVGITELWVSTAGAKPYPGRFGTDRFRTDAPWQHQLEATRWFLAELAPVARDLGVHINLETHEEITTFEILRLIESVGDDVLGIVFDTANVLIRGEHPVMAAERIAPYVRQTHIKDAYVELTDGGVWHQAVAVGDGAIDFHAIVGILAEHRPDLTLTFECAQPRSELEPGKGGLDKPPHVIELFLPEWLAGHPDLTKEELAAYVELVIDYTGRIRAGEVETWQARRERPFEYDEAIDWVKRSETHLLSVFDKLGIERG
jgi:sugar phosphate isomerase/epimerase